MPKVTVDGLEIEVPQGVTVLYGGQFWTKGIAYV